jgi:hypothetical protein
MTDNAAADLAARLWATMSPEERQSLVAGSYAEHQASEWLARVGQAPVPAGLYESFDTPSHWDRIAVEMIRIRLAEIREEDS